LRGRIGEDMDNMPIMGRKVSYKEFDIWVEGYCLLITGGMMSAVEAVIEREDGTVITVQIDRIQFLDRKWANCAL